MTVYETGRGPGGRTSTRRAGPDGAGWQFDHGAQYFAAKDPAFRAIVEDWRAEGLVAEWTGVFGTLDATTGTFVREDVSETKERWVGTPSMNAVAKGLARRPGISLVTSRRVTSFEGGPGVGDGSWTVVHRSSAPTATTDDPGAKTDPVPAEPPRRDARFVAVVAADKQAASDRSVRVYGEDPPLLSLAAPAVWEGMRASGQTPSFALMLAVKNGRKSGADDKDEDGAEMNAIFSRLFEFQGATVEGDDVVAWIADDSSKPGRRTGAPDADVTCWVVQSTPAYAARRVKAAATAPGTGAAPGATERGCGGDDRRAAETRREVREAPRRRKRRSVENRNRARRRASLGRGVSGRRRCGGGGGVGGGVPRRRGEESGGVRGFLCVPQDRRRGAQRGGRRSAGRGNDRRNARGVAVTPKLHVIDTRVRVVIISTGELPIRVRKSAICRNPDATTARWLAIL